MIQWFPGHMTKSMRMMEENVKLVDAVVYVTDARAPFACINRDLIKVFANKPVLYLINKADLVEERDVSAIAENFKKENKRTLALNGTLAKDGKAVLREIRAMLNETIERYRAKGMNKCLRVMVAGVPNTGKSTVINSICGQKRAVTGDKAGVTRGKQWIRLGEIELLDTPGTMPPKFDSQYYARHLAYIGSINDDILDMEELIRDFFAEISVPYRANITEKYSADPAALSLSELIDAVCAKRGFVKKGGEYDYTRCSKAVFDDFRKGKLGKICLETENYNDKED